MKGDEFHIETIKNVAKGLNKLDEITEKYISISVYSNKLFNNPHALDENTKLGRLFFNALCIVNFSPECKDLSIEERMKFYWLSGLIKCDISNTVTFTSILGTTDRATSRHTDNIYSAKTPNIVIESAIKRLKSKDKHFEDEYIHPSLVTNTLINEVSSLPLRTILELVIAVLVYGNKIYVVENPAVFSTILDFFDKIEGLSYPPIICGSGRLNYAVISLMERISSFFPEIEFLYSGDFDPDGIQIANSLLDNPVINSKLWRYDFKSYQICQPGTELTNNQRSKIGNILQDKEKYNKELVEVAESIKNEGKNRYQEGLIKFLIHDIIENGMTIKEVEDNYKKAKHLLDVWA